VRMGVIEKTRLADFEVYELANIAFRAANALRREELWPCRIEKWRMGVYSTAGMPKMEIPGYTQEGAGRLCPGGGSTDH